MALGMACWRLSWSSGIYSNVTILLLCDYLKYKGWIVWRTTRLHKTSVSLWVHHNFIVSPFRVLITVLLGLISHLGVTYQMLIIRLACTLESTLVAPMEKSCLARFSSLPLPPLSICHSARTSLINMSISTYLPYQCLSTLFPLTW